MTNTPGLLAQSPTVFYIPAPVPALTPQQAFDLALQYRHCGRLTEAADLCRQLLHVYPDNASISHLLGLLAFQSGSVSDAEKWLRQALLAQPGNPAFYNDLGDILQSAGRLEEAIAAYRQALQIQPQSAPILNNLGNALKARDRLEEAVSAYRAALALEGGFAEIHSNLGAALRQRGNFDEAIAALRQAVHLKPGYAMAHNNLGHVLLDKGQFPEAIASFERAIALQPGFALAHNNLGAAHKAIGQIDEAIAAYRRALEVDGDNFLALGNLANTLHARGELDAARPLIERVMASPHTPPAAYSNCLALLHHDPLATPESLAPAHRAFEARYARPFAAARPLHANLPQPERPLRLGFVSPFFGIHPVGFFLVRPLESLDRREFHVTCYNDGIKADDLTARLRACASEWRDVRGLPDDELTQRIRQDGIDILFDLAGHTVGNRLLVFARKPAPIQVTWLDYVGTTGLSAIDYLLADARQVPVGTEKFYSEEILRLPDDYICFDLPPPSPDVGPLPAEKNGFVTFASFNTVSKVTAATLEIWGRILHGVPDSRLLLKNRGFEDPVVAHRLRGCFQAMEIDPDRLVLRGWSPRFELLAAYNDVDIALDTLPYNGGLTTCEALWMGVPVITCPGETFAGRHGLAHLTAAGVTETIAADRADYVRLAVALAHDLPRLKILRSGLRSRLTASPLCDGPRFASHLRDLLRGVWRRWCRECALEHRNP